MTDQIEPTEAEKDAFFALIAAEEKRKIAAHDDLVEELSRALPFLEDMLDDPAYKNGFVAERIKKGRAALAKAKGETK